MGGYEIIGNRDRAIAIVEIEKGENAKKISKDIMKKHKNVKTVLKKMSERKGVIRTRSYRIIAGEKNTKIIHLEYGYRIFLDPRKVYFSPRESTERQRLASLVKKGERILLMFAGVGPIGIAIAKKQSDVEIVAIEINREAVKYMKKNIEINKLNGKIKYILGDVKEHAKKYSKEFDRIIMPLPHKSELFLDEALNCLKPKGWIHLYNIRGEEEIQDVAKEISKKINAKKFFIKKVLPYAPRVNKYCIDFML